jgi:hypothetical protein
LELAFGTRVLRTLCESEDAATSQLGPAVAEMLLHRLADLRAATSPHDLQVGRPRSVAPDAMAVDLAEGFQMTFCANHRTIPTLPDGAIDWSRVRRVRVLSIAKATQV